MRKVLIAFKEYEIGAALKYSFNLSRSEVRNLTWTHSRGTARRVALITDNVFVIRSELLGYVEGKNILSLSSDMRKERFKSWPTSRKNQLIRLIVIKPTGSKDRSYRFSRDRYHQGYTGCEGCDQNHPGGQKFHLRQVTIPLEMAKWRAWRDLVETSQGFTPRPGVKLTSPQAAPTPQGCVSQDHADRVPHENRPGLPRGRSHY